MIRKLFTLDVYSCCLVYSSAAFKPVQGPEFLPEFIEGNISFKKIRVLKDELGKGVM